LLQAQEIFAGSADFQAVSFQPAGPEVAFWCDCPGHDRNFLWLSAERGVSRSAEICNRVSGLLPPEVFDRIESAVHHILLSAEDAACLPR